MFNSLVSGLPVRPASEFRSDRGRTVCISGHREKNILPYKGDNVYAGLTVSAVKLMLYRYIDMAAEKGYTEFISGLATGTDLWAAAYIIKKKQSNPDLRLIGAMPYLRHAERFPKAYLELLGRVEREADELLTVSEVPDIAYSKRGHASELYRDRNYFMVDRSSAVIAFVNRNSFASGTVQTVNYAYRSGRLVCGFGLTDIYAIMDMVGADLRNIGREIAFLPNVFDTAP